MSLSIYARSCNVKAYKVTQSEGYILTRHGRITTIQINKRNDMQIGGKLPQVQGISGCKDGLGAVQ